MQTDKWSFEDAHYKLKLARQKKRLRIKDFHKYLRWLVREQRRLDQLQRDLPMLPLDEPYQNGWKRTFVLRPDVAASEKAGFYQALLEKINTVKYSKDKKFRIRAGKKNRKKVWVDEPQSLTEFSPWSFHGDNCKLTEPEKRLFRAEERMCSTGKGTYVIYVFTEAWRFQLTVTPHIVTHIKMVDGALESDIQRLDNRIARHRFQEKMWKEKNGCIYDSRRYLPKTINPYKQKSITRILNEEVNSD